MRVMIAAGGTGGHVFPALAVAGEIRRIEPETAITFVGRPEGIERREFAREGDRYLAVRARRLPRHPGLATLAAFGGTVLASGRCVGEFLRRRPDAALGFGGYVSAPAVLAARLMGIPTAIHEQNAVAGKVNRWLARFVDRVFVSCAESAGGLPRARTEWCGMPVRPDVVGREPRPEAFGLERDRATVFFLGGSQGARRLCDAAADCIDILADRGFRFQAILQTGEANRAAVAAGRLRMPTAVRAFIEDMGNAYACADVVVARAGASSIAEIAANGLPAILVPYPYATEDHQRRNAQPLVDAGAAEMLEDASLDGARLADKLAPFLEDGDVRRRMGAAARNFARPDAAARIARRALELARRQPSAILEPQEDVRQG